MLKYSHLSYYIKILSYKRLKLIYRETLNNAIKKGIILDRMYESHEFWENAYDYTKVRVS